MIQPHSTCVMTMVMKKQLRPRKDTCKFAVHMIVMPSIQHHTQLESDIGTRVDLYRDHVNTRLDLDRDIDIMNRIVYMDDDVDNVNRKAEEFGGKVYRVMMTAACDKVSRSVPVSNSPSVYSAATYSFMHHTYSYSM